MQKKLNSLVRNQIVLYIVLALSLVNLISYLSQGNLCAVILFFAIGLAITKYNKNMIVVLLGTIVATNLLVRVGFLKLFGLRQGFKEGVCTMTDCPTISPIPTDLSGAMADLSEADAAQCYKNGELITGPLPCPDGTEELADGDTNTNVFNKNIDDKYAYYKAQKGIVAKSFYNGLCEVWRAKDLSGTNFCTNSNAQETAGTTETSGFTGLREGMKNSNKQGFLGNTTKMAQDVRSGGSNQKTQQLNACAVDTSSTVNEVNSKIKDMVATQDKLSNDIKGITGKINNLLKSAGLIQ